MTRISSRLAALFLLIAAFALPAPVAFAQDDQSLPDPNEEQQSGDDNGGDLPKTGLPALILAAGGALFLSSGAVIRPAKRRRRERTPDEWLARVNPEHYAQSRRGRRRKR